MKYLKRVPGITNKALLQICYSQFMQSQSVVMNRRYTLREDWRLYENDAKNPDYVQANMIYANLQAFSASRYSDELTVRFVEREFSDSEKAEKWTKIAQFDQDEMGLSEINYAKTLDEGMTGVGIREFVGWDEVKQCPVVSERNPMAWLPDPHGWLNAENFRWHGFQTLQTRDYMEDNGFDMEVVDQFFPVTSNSEIWMFDPYNNMPPNTETQENPAVALRQVVYWYTTWKGEKYQIAVNRDFTAIGRIARISDYMKSNDGRIPWPITLSYYRPKRYDPFGTSMPDLLRDKQRAKTKLFNLQVAKATRSSLGGHRVYNKNKIPNRADLGSLSVDPKLIGIDLQPNETLDNVIKEVQFSELNNDNIIVSNNIDYEGKFATGIDPLTMGIVPDKEMTKAEAQQIQGNANLLISYGNTIDNWGEKDFWWKWKCMYNANFKGEKLIRVTNPIGYTTLTIKEKDLKTKFDPDIIIETASQAKEQARQTIEGIQLLLPFVQSMGNPFSAKFTLRMLARKLGFDNETANMIVSLSGAEEEALMQLELLNRNVTVDMGSIDVMNDDHDAYIAIYRQALPTPARQAAILARMNAKIQQEKMLKEQAQMMGMQAGPAGMGSGPDNLANAASAQMVSSSVQGAADNNKLKTTADVKSQ